MRHMCCKHCFTKTLEKIEVEVTCTFLRIFYNHVSHLLNSDWDKTIKYHLLIGATSEANKSNDKNLKLIGNILLIIANNLQFC